MPIGKGRVQTLLERVGVFAVPSWRLGRALDGWGLLYDPEGAGSFPPVSCSTLSST